MPCSFIGLRGFEKGFKESRVKVNLVGVEKVYEYILVHVCITVALLNHLLMDFSVVFVSW